ncbi:MAG TPA: DUF362 domain-containing protein [Candidatus Krumholzibacteria bacterium]|nr:DUF362 domain-containing protein [Candidatus Krumholzibacteria bacterium]
MGAPADVFLLPPGPDPDAPVAAAGVGRLVERMGLGGAARTGRWAVKVQLGPRGLAAAIAPAWAAAAARAVAGPGGAGRTFCCDTLSINLAGLDTPGEHLALAAVKGYGPGGEAPGYRVADDPAHGPSFAPPDGRGPSLALLAAQAAGLLVLSAVRPHPHLGFGGALFALGAGLADRQGKIGLHRDIRPKVDTPLCAGCGSCLAVCLFDAIRVTGGRAIIDHELCTGCGECMNHCFMAGIAPDDAAGIPLFQKRLAQAARAALAGAADGPRPAGYVNVLVRLDRRTGGPGRRKERSGDVGVLASRDPVALDQATWDLAAGGPLGSLPAWSGFTTVPGALLDEAAALGLGRPQYRLVTI